MTQPSSWGAAGAVPAILDVLVIMQRQGGVSRTVKVPQIQFIAGVSGHSSSQQGEGGTLSTWVWRR